MSGRRGGMTDGGVNSQAQRRGQDAREDRGHEGHGEAGHGQGREEGHGAAGHGQERGEEGHRHARRARHAPARRHPGRVAHWRPERPAPPASGRSAAAPRSCSRRRRSPSCPRCRRLPGPGTAAEAPAGDRTPETPSETPTPVIAAPGERQRKLHRPHPVAKAVPASKAVAKTGTRPAGPRRRSPASRPSVQPAPAPAPAAARGPLKAVRDDVSVSPVPAGPAHVVLSPGVEELLQAGVSALRVAAEASGLSPEDVERQVAQTLAFLRRRLTGDYTVDEFGFDEDFTEHVYLPAAAARSTRMVPGRGPRHREHPRPRVAPSSWPTTPARSRWTR